MEYQQNHNLLEEIESIGFKVTWNLIRLGFKEYDSFHIGLNQSDLMEYVKGHIGEDDNKQEQFIKLICVEDDFPKINNLVAEFSVVENKTEDVEMRKWRVLKLLHLLKETDTGSSVFVTLVYDFLLSFSNIAPVPSFYPYDVISFFKKTPKAVFEECDKWLANEINEIKFLDR